MKTQKKILLVDDEPEIRSMLTKQLSKFGYDVVQANDGYEAMEAFLKGKPDLIVTDMHMPRVTGYDFLMMLREKVESVVSTPAIVMSPDEKMKERVETLELTEFLKKPFEAETLLEKVKKIFNTKVETILIVEDDPSIRIILQSRLKANGYRVVPAVDGMDALDQLRTLKPDLIITDILMPRLSGYDLLKRLREEEIVDRHMPILVISARADMEDHLQAWDILDFIPKPFDAEVLLGKIRKIFEQRAIQTKVVDKNLDGLSAAVQPVARGTEKKKVLLMSAQDIIMNSLTSFFTAQGFEVFKALDIPDALAQAASQRPSFILCQYWEDSSILDAATISRTLQQVADTKSIPFYVFCANTLAPEAARDFATSRIIRHQDVSDLLVNLTKTGLLLNLK